MVWSQRAVAMSPNLSRAWFDQCLQFHHGRKAGEKCNTNLLTCFLGDAERKYCKFRPDPSIPPMFSAMNEDYLGSGWSRGHMAPAGDNKYSPVGLLLTFLGSLKGRSGNSKSNYVALLFSVELGSS